MSTNLFLIFVGFVLSGDAHCLSQRPKNYSHIFNSPTVQNSQFVFTRRNKVMSSSQLNSSTPDTSGDKGKCIPCQSMDTSMLLTMDQIQTETITNLKLWSIIADSSDSTSTANKISRKFTAKNFRCALDAINAMGEIAEREGHHPDFHLTSYREVEIVLYTHRLGGVTQNDLSLAKMLDSESEVVYSPKWLRENPEAAKD